MHKFEYVVAGIMLIACFFIVPWSYNHWMAVTGPHATIPNQVNQAPTLSAQQVDDILCAAKSLSENQDFGEEQLSASQLEKRQIVLGFLFPANKETA